MVFAVKYPAGSHDVHAWNRPRHAKVELGYSSPDAATSCCRSDGLKLQGAVKVRTSSRNTEVFSAAGYQILAATIIKTLNAWLWAVTSLVLPRLASWCSFSLSMMA